MKLCIRFKMCVVVGKQERIEGRDKSLSFLCLKLELLDMEYTKMI